MIRLFQFCEYLFYWFKKNFHEEQHDIQQYGKAVTKDYWQWKSFKETAIAQKTRFPLAANCLPFRGNTQIKSSETRLQHQ